MSVRLKIVFRKGEGARYLSHLDLMSTLEFAMRRAQLPVELSEGYNPRPRMGLAAPLPLGHIGEKEILEVALREAVDCTLVMRNLQSALPPGLQIVSVEEIPLAGKSAASRLRSVLYRVELPDPIDDLFARVELLLSRPKVEIEEKRDQTSRFRDIRPHILSMEATSIQSIQLELSLDNAGTVRPEQILSLLGISDDGAKLIRQQITIASHG
ncbi:MAG: TIGR03936 family radical SAM-associated protein [Chloroflexota bacterium]